MRIAFPEGEVKGYQTLQSVLTNDPKDRHVLAAAIKGQCPLILTFNVKYFSKESTSPWLIDVCHPQDYLLILYEMDPKHIMGCLGGIAGRKKTKIEDILLHRGKSLPLFSSKVLDDLGAD
ncbi:MAG: PIN domain-containing protein [Verrucomicrobiota bacterium]|nr:PIN domain-containing protein [Verrucomicrobiota bacterium]